MKKDEIIEFLQKQNAELKALLLISNTRADRLSDQVTTLTNQVAKLVAQLSSLEGAITQKDEAIAKQKSISKNLSKLGENKSEKIKPTLSKEELETLEQARAIQRKRRKNNGAKRDMHPDMEVQEHVVYPTDPEFDIERARIIGCKGDNGEYPYRVSIRYECIPMKFIKHVYKIYTYTQDGKPYEGKAPKAAFLNSSFDASFLAGIMQLRYMYAMPVERIVNYFAENGFSLSKATANGFIKRASELLENIYKGISQVVLSDKYISADETYYKILVPAKDIGGKGVRKGYFWVIIGVKSQLIYTIYEDGSRSEKVILNQLKDYRGTLQSDAFTAYKKLESDVFPNIQRIACLQHIKRKFLDIGEADKDAKIIVDLINRLYHEEHKHQVGVDGWSVEDNRVWRGRYAPDILAKLRRELERICASKSLLPKSDDLLRAVNHMLTEFDAVEAIFTRGDTLLDNNLVERYNRYFSLSRRNSLFFGSHKGAERGAVLYSLALSCKMNNVNLFDYLTSVIATTAEWQPNTPILKYRDLLPDRWQNSQK